MRWLLLLGMVGAACSKISDDEDEPKLSHRARDAGPAVVFVDRTETAGVAPVEEKEPNGKRDGAQLLSLPGAVRGRIDEAGDRDVYELKIPQAGTLSARLTAVDDADLILEVSDASGDLLATSDDGPAKTAEALPNVFVQPGTATVTVYEYTRAARKKEKAPPPRTGPSGNYELLVELLPVPEAGEERERNDQAAFADPLQLGAAGRGFVGWRKDVDYWKLSLEGMRPDEVLAVEASAVPGVALRLALVDAAGKTLVERKGRPGQPLALGSVTVAEKTPFVFVAVSGEGYNADERYNLTASVRAAQLDEESEPNDTPETASPLADIPGAESGTRIGTLAGTDVDLFRLDPVPEARALSVTVTPPAGLDVEVTLLGPGGKTLLGPVDVAKKGGAEKIVGAELPPGMAVFVRVKGKGAASEPYRLAWSVTAPALPVPGVDE